jgi:hypothetical protein
MRFDYYSGTVDRQAVQVVDVLSKGLDMVDVVPLTGNRHYRKGFKVVRGESTLSNVFFENVSGSTETLFTGKSSFAADVAGRIRSAFPSHSVTRADVCEDFDSPGSFDTLMQGLLPIADQFNISVSHQGDWHRGINGRTLYFGSRDSVFYARLYEKGKQLGVSPDWARFEIEVRPQGKGRLQASKLTEPEFFGCSTWGIAMGEHLSISDLRRVPVGSLYSKLPLEKKIDNLCKQYGPTILGLLEQCYGDETELGKTLVQRVYDVRAAERQRLRELHGHKNIH